MKNLISSLSRNDFYNIIDTILHFTFSFYLVNILVLRLSSIEYANFMRYYAFVSLIITPIQIWANNLLSHLALNNSSEYRSYFGDITILLSGSIVIFFIVSLFLGKVFLISTISAISILYYSSAINVIDKKTFFLHKLLITIFSIFFTSYLIYVKSDILTGYAAFFAIKAILFFGFLKSEIIFDLSGMLKRIQISVGNFFLILSQNFGDNGLRAIFTYILNPQKFVIFDLLIRIFYAGRNLSGRFHYSYLLIYINFKEEFVKKKIKYLNIFSSFGYLVSVILYQKYLNTDIHNHANVLVFAILSSVAMYINLQSALYYQILLKHKDYLILAIVSFIIPFVSFLLSLLNSMPEVYIPIAVICQSVIIFLIFNKKFIHEVKKYFKK